MSLNNFKNSDVILSTTQFNIGQTLDSRDANLLTQYNLTPSSLSPSSSIEFHVYTQDNNYVGGIHELTLDLLTSNKTYDNILNVRFDIVDALSGSLAIERGSYKYTVRGFNTLVGSYYTQPIYIDNNGISPDRTELKLMIRTDEASRRQQLEKNTNRQQNTLTNELTLLNKYQYNIYNRFATHDKLCINFGNDNVFKLLNVSEGTDGAIYVKLYEPLPTFINEKDTCWIAEAVSDAYIDNVVLLSETITTNYNSLRGPNFNVDTVGFESTATTLRNWNDLLSTNTITAQTIVNRYFSGSIDDVDLPIDYSAFDNFVFYSSAKERLDNFIYKLRQIESYDNQINTISSSLAGSSSYALNNITSNQNKRAQVIGTFDSFERWLYYDATGSLFTNAISGSTIGAQGYTITTYPKYLVSGSYVLHNTTSSIATTWYNGLASTASLYDEQNIYALVNHIPDFIRNDVANNEFILFTNMIAQHYDTLWTYIDALSKLRTTEEHPKLGIPKQLVSTIADQYGIKILNGRQNVDLWKYKLGVNTSGSYQSTGSIFSKSYEDLVADIGRRMVINMPYLLKTRGTERSLKALMNIYGIPQTFFNIQEYGGPAISGSEEVSIVEDRFAYAIKFNGSNNRLYASRSYVNLPLNTLSYTPSSLLSSFASRIATDLGTLEASTCVTNTLGVLILDDSRPPDTIEFRFRPSTSQTVNTSVQLLSYTQETSLPATTADWSILLNRTGSFSGSSNYGRLSFAISGSPISLNTSYLPLFDNDFWNVRLTTSTPYVPGNTDTTFTLSIQKASDFTAGKIIHSSSVSQNITTDVYFNSWCNPSVNGLIVPGGIFGATKGITGSGIYSGQLQAYKEYMEVINDTTFNYHTLNPASYRGNNETSSYYTLVRYLPLGVDRKKYTYSGGTFIVSSSQPTKDYADYLNAYGYNYSTDAIVSGSGISFADIVETYYTFGVSTIGLNNRSEKIRLEDNRLVGILSPAKRAERSRFDYAPLDSNKLSIVFSPQAYINRDIYNNLGYVNLNSYFGNPLDEYENEYTKLKQLNREYFKKYSIKPDNNKYIRAFSLYDFSIFEMFKQFLPLRTNLVAGVLIEPNVLERSKVAVTKQPRIENPQLEQTISALPQTVTGEYKNYEGTISSSLLVASDYKRISLIRSGSTYITASVSPLEYSPTGSAIYDQRPSSIYSKVNYFYGTGSATDSYNKSIQMIFSASLGLFYSKSLSTADYRDDTSVYYNKRFEGTRLTGPGFNIPSNQTFDKSPVVTITIVGGTKPGGNAGIQPTPPKTPIVPTLPRTTPPRVTTPVTTPPAGPAGTTPPRTTTPTAPATSTNTSNVIPPATNTSNTGQQVRIITRG
jgi:hypothetical protein